MWNKFWQGLKKYSWKLVGSLIMDTKPNGELGISLGRVCFLFVLGVLSLLWFKSLFSGKALSMPSGLMEVFYILAGYVFGSKGMDAVIGLLQVKAVKTGGYLMNTDSTEIDPKE